MTTASWHARAFLALRFRRNRLVTLLCAWFDGIWLGTFDRETLATLDERFYDEARESVSERQYRYFDDEYNGAGLFDWESSAIDEHFPAGCRVAVTGAGGGREVLALLEREFDAVGYEPNRGFVEVGSDFLRRKGYPDRLHTIERDAFPACIEQIDAIVLGWGSFMLIPGRSRRAQFLKAARGHLEVGAPLLVSFFERRQTAAYFAGVARTANAVRHLRRREPVDLGDTLIPYFAHHFTREEIEAELAAARFRLVTFESDPYPHAIARAI